MPSFKWRNKHDGSVSVSAPPEKLWQSDSESSQPARQGSLPSWSLARDRSNSDASLARRFTRQMSLPITIPFNKRRKSTVLTEPVCQDDCKLLKMFPYEVREMIYLSVVDPRDWTINLREVPEDKRERKKQEKKLKRGEVGSRKTTLHSFLELMPVCRQITAETRPLLFGKARVCCSSLTTFEVFVAANSGLSAISGDQPWMQLRHVSLEVTFPYLLFSPREGGPNVDEEDPSKIQYYNSKSWNATCESLKRMKNLKSLRIVMYARDYREMHPNWPDRPGRRLWETLVQPLLALERCDDFVVAVSWPVDDDENENGWPFVVQRRSGQPDVAQGEGLDGAASDRDAASTAPGS